MLMQYKVLNKRSVISKIVSQYPCVNLRVLSLPELKPKVSFLDHLSSFGCPPFCTSVFLSLPLSVCTPLFLQTPRAHFNQSWRKATLGEGDLSAFLKRRATHVPKGR